MAKEIERKFLINRSKWKVQGEKNIIKQAYLSTDPERVVRVRISGDNAILTIKGKSVGITRDEFDYPIPLNDAEELIKMCKDTPIVKCRYLVEYGGKLWEVDEFLEENSGLIVAEVELNSENEVIDLPEWIGQEVSDDKRYYNSWLSKNPYTKWDY